VSADRADERWMMSQHAAIFTAHNSAQHIVNPLSDMVESSFYTVSQKNM